MSEEPTNKTPKSSARSAILKRPQTEQTKSKAKGNHHGRDEENPSKIKQIQSLRTQKSQIQEKLDDQETYGQEVKKSAKSKMTKNSASKKKMELTQEIRKEQLMKNKISLSKSQAAVEPGKDIQTIQEGLNHIASNQKEFSFIKQSQQISQLSGTKKIATESKKAKLIVSGKQSKTQVKTQVKNQAEKPLTESVNMVIEIKHIQPNHEPKIDEIQNNVPEQKQQAPMISVQKNKKEKSELKNKEKSASAKKLQKYQLKNKSEKKVQKNERNVTSEPSNVKNLKSQFKNQKSALKNGKSSKKFLDEDEKNGVKSKKKTKIEEAAG